MIIRCLSQMAFCAHLANIYYPVMLCFRHGNPEEMAQSIPDGARKIRNVATRRDNRLACVRGRTYKRPREVRSIILKINIPPPHSHPELPRCKNLPWEAPDVYGFVNRAFNFFSTWKAIPCIDLNLAGRCKLISLNTNAQESFSYIPADIVTSTASRSWRIRCRQTFVLHPW